VHGSQCCTTAGWSLLPAASHTHQNVSRSARPRLEIVVTRALFTPVIDVHSLIPMGAGTDIAIFKVRGISLVCAREFCPPSTIRKSCSWDLWTTPTCHGRMHRRSNVGWIKYIGTRKRGRDLPKST